PRRHQITQGLRIPALSFGLLGSARENGVCFAAVLFRQHSTRALAPCEIESSWACAPPFVPGPASVVHSPARAPGGGRESSTLQAQLLDFWLARPDAKSVLLEPMHSSCR